MLGLIIFVIVVVVLVCAYLLAIMPRMIHKPDSTPFKGVLYAHRGLHDNRSDAPENSMAAFQKAVDAGYGIEVDIRLSKDKEVVIFHDETLERVCGKPGKVQDYTYEELKQFFLLDTQEKIPLFKDFLDMIGNRVPLIVELKAEWTDISVCAAADRLLQEHHGTYCIESFNPLVLIWYKNHRPRVMRGQLSDNFVRSGEFSGILYIILQNLLLNGITKPDFIAYNHQYAGSLSRRICRKLYRNLAVAFTIRSQQELDSMQQEFDLFIFDSFIPKQ